MKDLIKNTGIDNFFSGQKLTSDTLNSMNSSINELVEVFNLYLKNKANINIEENTNQLYKVEEAIKLVPPSRRNPGITVEFKEYPKGNWTQLIYNGPTQPSTRDWENPENWVRSLKSNIDGGEW